MTSEITKTIAPNSLAVTRIKLVDGSTSEFEYSYDIRTKTSMYFVPLGITSAICSPIVLVDSAGNEWDSVDVEFHTLMKGR